MKRTAGRNTAVTNTVVLTFDLIMLFASALLYQSGAVVLTAFDPHAGAVFFLWSRDCSGGVGQHPLQNTFAAGNRVLDILDETPVVEEITGKTGNHILRRKSGAGFLLLRE